MGTMFTCQNGVQLIGMDFEVLTIRFATPAMDAVTCVLQLGKRFVRRVAKQHLPFRVGDGGEVAVRQKTDVRAVVRLGLAAFDGASAAHDVADHGRAVPHVLVGVVILD